ncbi:type IV pilus biogenesis/stability protein PilW [Colwellia sp. UCD-KL20]|uniref:type IV pilus biogenesis/stability protein PilW n=1 Tax=Colwellia sp. UCD-KL20 TaxID=1917165 RepID=UPI000970934E|nr:type IV pilus biogenesis/stability protein PilW [Colwellia sp. UCD-KL20]
MPKIYQIITVGVLSSLLSACVTQNYENNAENPVTERNSTDNEIAMTRISLGMGYLNMGNTTQAKLNLEKAKRFAPNLTQVYTAFAHYYDVVDEPEQAITAFEKALSLNVDDADTLNNYGVFLCKREKYDESEKYMLKAIAVPSYLLVSQSYENLALCQLEAKNFEKAEMYLAKSISHSPSSASALLQMLRLQYAMGKYDEAIAYLRRYEKSTRRFTPNALALAYKVYEKMNNRGIAKNYASLLVKMFPNSYEAKQYILNGLQHVEADDLASEFLLLNKKNSNKPKKRTMVLSPNKKSGISLSSKRKVTNKSLNNRGSESAKRAAKDIDATKKQVTTTNANVENDIVVANDKATTTPKEGVTGDKNIENTAKKLLDTSEKEDVLAQSSIDDDGNKMLTLPIHVIVKGDSLFSISKRYNIKMQQIERWNGFKRSKILKVGDVIYLADPKKALKR